MLITLEGLDGSGKSTCMATLRDSSLLPEGTTFTREPTDSWYGEAVAHSIETADADPLAELFLYTADHAAHLSRTVEPALERGDVVISDRFSDSRYAYQGTTLADRFDDPLAFVQDVHTPWTRVPDATIYLDVEPETGVERSGATNKFERTSALEAVRANYETLIEREPERFVRVDAERAQEAVVEDVLEVIGTLVDTP